MFYQLIDINKATSREVALFIIASQSLAIKTIRNVYGAK